MPEIYTCCVFVLCIYITGRCSARSLGTLLNVNFAWHPNGWVVRGMAGNKEINTIEIEMVMVLDENKVFRSELYESRKKKPLAKLVRIAK